MTDQSRDICIFDGRQWVVEDPGELALCVPTNKQLGFSTIMDSTANWSGRIDHFLVHNYQLYLFKVEVSLPEDQRDLVPPGARRETRYIYEPIENHSSSGMTMEERIHESRYFVYDDLKIDYSGELLLLYPIGDMWEYPEYDAPEPYLETRLEFDRGKLEDVDERPLEDDD